MNKPFSILFALLAVSFTLSLCLGSVQIPVGEILQTLIDGSHQNQAWAGIIWKIRLPKAITALLAGGALGVAGLQMQTLFRNPLAGPSVLGITAGASLGVALVVLTGFSSVAIFALGRLGIAQSWLMILAAVGGASLVFMLILAISFKVKNNVALLIIGLMVGNMTIALVSIWQYFSAPELIKDFLLWTFGNLGGVTNSQLGVLAGAVAVGTIGTFLIAKPLNMLLIGDDYAKSMGLNVQQNRIIIIVFTSVLAGVVTGFCGPIGFIGIAIPHIAREVFHTSDHKKLVPASFLLGAIVLQACDIIAQLPTSHSVLPINAVTAFFGSPVVIWVMLRRKKAKQATKDTSTSLQFSPEPNPSIQMEINQLSVGYGKEHLVSQLTASIESSKLIALLGPNGAGKSTLLRAIAGLQNAQSGSILFNTSDWASLSAKEKSKYLGIVLTERDFFGNMKVEELVMMGRYTHTDWWGQLSQADKQWTNWALRQVGMATFSKREISSLSDGERQKALIARVLTQDTPILLLDEPTAHLDLPNRIRNFRLFKRLSKQHNKALLLSTHELDLALKYADEIWLIDGSGTLTIDTAEAFKHSGKLESVFGLFNEDGATQPLRIKD